MLHSTKEKDSFNVSWTQYGAIMKKAPHYEEQGLIQRDDGMAHIDDVRAAIAAIMDN